ASRLARGGGNWPESAGYEGLWSPVEGRNGNCDIEAYQSMPMRRAFGEALLSAGTVIVGLFGLVSLDDRVRGEVAIRWSTPTQELASAGHHASALTAVIAQAARDQSLAHAPMLIFALAATVLVLFMLRT